MNLPGVTATQLRSGPGDVRLPPAPQPGPPLALLLRGEALSVLWPSRLPCPEETHLAQPQRGGGRGLLSRLVAPGQSSSVCGGPCGDVLTWPQRPPWASGSSAARLCAEGTVV